MVRAAIKRIGVYYYIFPTYSQARKVIWDSITNSGERFLAYIPDALIENTNSTEMKIILKNGSLIQLIGSDNIDNLMGTNPIGIIFSEYALQDPQAYQFLRPILLANGGWAIFVSTPRGKNHLWELYNIATNSQGWFVSKLSIEDTNHIPLEEIQKELNEGLVSEDLIQQEYYCSFTMGVEGSYYAKYLDKMRLDQRIGNVPWENGFQVHTFWDIGYSDSCAIIFAQIIGQTIKVIDYYEKNKEGLEHYVQVIKNKPYIYGKHVVPHDMRVVEFGSGISRIEKARQLGLEMVVADNVSIEDGIEAVRSNLSRMWIDQTNCAKLIKALENYRQEFDNKKMIYKLNPLHNWASHGADAVRYMCVSLHKVATGMTPKDIEASRNRALYSDQADLPHWFRNNR